SACLARCHAGVAGSVRVFLAPRVVVVLCFSYLASLPAITSTTPNPATPAGPILFFDGCIYRRLSTHRIPVSSCPAAQPDPFHPEHARNVSVRAAIAPPSMRHLPRLNLNRGKEPAALSCLPPCMNL